LNLRSGDFPPAPSRFPLCTLFPFTLTPLFPALHLGEFPFVCGAWGKIRFVCGSERFILWGVAAFVRRYCLLGSASLRRAVGFFLIALNVTLRGFVGLVCRCCCGVQRILIVAFCG